MSNQAVSSRAGADNPMRRHEWEMVSGFVLSLPENRVRVNACVLAPIAQALAPFGLADDLLCQISGEVETAGEALRSCCPDGKLDCVNVRVQVSSKALKGTPTAQGWGFFVIKQIASSESDNLEALDHPSCFIDLHVFPQE
jgi:hypothetical protein